MTSKPSSRRPRASTLAPRSWPSRPGLAMSTLIGRSDMRPETPLTLGTGGRRSRWARNSARVLSRVRKMPSTALVVMIVPGLRTPRMTAQRCVASSTTPTPWGCRRSWRKSAICCVSRSWTWRRRGYISTMRGVFDMEDGAVDEAVRIHVVARGQLRVHAVDALRRAGEAWAIGILADLDQDLAPGRPDATVARRGQAGPAALEAALPAPRAGGG